MNFNPAPRTEPAAAEHWVRISVAPAGYLLELMVDQKRIRTQTIAHELTADEVCVAAQRMLNELGV